MASDDQSRDTQAVEPPRGMYPGRLDDKGRLKLPAEFQHFLNVLPEKKLFVTSLDRRIAQIYPMHGLAGKRKVFRELTATTRRCAQDVAFNANDLGADAEMDSQGRVLFNTTLREELDLQNQELHLYAYRGHIEVLTEAIYQERAPAGVEGASGERGFARAGGIEVMPYALSGAARRSSRVPGDPSRRNLPGCDRGAGRAYARDRAAADDRVGDRERSRRGVARVGAANTLEFARSHPLSSGKIFGLAGSGGGSRASKRWTACWRTWE